ncbi:abortive infection family protein [Mammaliicoccus sciuri]|uniref:abortive infection family protein n=1 Tax=Mammaliicoccus sciuri TaxID=1296 RepID=UPI001FB3A3F0|nr:abortive infection family protein [Mammaliicoccus sciuri]MCJ0965541.1 hypothetical protein [Mammaliicoccus sciuri]MEB7733453.1 hypothetical protein [Mammaliicoccus sciuri]
MKSEDREILKKLYNDNGNVLNFNKDTLSRFIINILDYEPFHKFGDISKGKVLNEIIDNSSDNDCLILANNLLDKVKSDFEKFQNDQSFLLDEEISMERTKDYELKIKQTENILRKYDTVTNIDINFTSDKYTNMYDLQENVDIHINKGLYDLAIDRVHTLFHSYLSQKCLNLKLNPYKSDGNLEPLNSLFNKVVNEINKRELLESSLTQMILLNSKKIFEIFNKARNSESSSHPAEKWLPKNEALYVINIVFTTINLLDSIIKEQGDKF